jgi:hypothetical protein
MNWREGGRGRIWASQAKKRLNIFPLTKPTAARIEQFYLFLSALLIANCDKKYLAQNLFIH